MQLFCLNISFTFPTCDFSIAIVDCNPQTCCLEQSFFSYIPSLGRNLFFAIFFAVVAISQLFFFWSFRTFTFTIAMIVGLSLEIVGYASPV